MNIHARYRRAKAKIAEILSTNTFEEICNYRQLFLSTHDEQYRTFNNLYSSYRNYQKIVTNYESTHNRHTCENCKRRNIPLNETNRRSLKRKTYKYIDRPSSSDGDVILCTECTTYLTTEDSSDDVSWPSYIWYLIQNEDIQQNYGEDIWRFIPITWRTWWLDSVKSIYNHIFAFVSLENPTPVFVDRTSDIDDWDRLIATYDLTNLSVACNKYLQPTIKCPFGCSEFIHRHGQIPYDIICQRFLQKCSIKTLTKKKQQKEKMVLSAREDFLVYDEEIEKWLMNPDWKVMPSISLVEGKGPCVLTCREHDGGTNKFMIHQCKWKHNLPARRSDQLAQVVINPRQLKPIKASKYSHAFQMYQQTGSFNGIDTCTNTTYGKFDKCSLLEKEAEARSLYNRHDVNSHLSRLVEEDVVSDIVAQSKRQYAYEYGKKEDFRKYNYGATYVPLEAAIILQREMNNSNTKATITEPVERIVRFKKYWSASIYPCQTMTPHGIMFTVMPDLKTNVVNTKNIWILSNLIGRVESLWQVLDEKPLDVRDWHGWMMVHLTKHCFNMGSRKQSTNDPFKHSEIDSPEKLASKIGDLPLEEYFRNTSKVSFQDLYRTNNQIIVSPSEDVPEILIVNRFDVQPNQMLPRNIQVNGLHYELVTIVGTRNNISNANNWEGVTYSRHAGPAFYNWWKNKRDQTTPIKIDELGQDLDPTYDYTLVYSLSKRVEVQKLREEYIKHLGGQAHVKCDIHKTPLIVSADKNRKCGCGKKSHMICTDLECDVSLCRPCYTGKSKDEVNYIPPPLDRIDISEVLGQVEDVNEEDLEEDETEIYNRLAETDNFDEFFLHSIEDDLDPIGIEEENDRALEIIPTTHAGVQPLEIENKTKYGGSKGNYTISGHVLLNQCGSLLARKKHEIKGNLQHNHVIQKLSCACQGYCVPTMYPEGLLFPSIHYSMGQDNCSTCGCIPASLMTPSGSTSSKFESIDKHIRSRLTNCSSATSSNPNYICFCYDMMTNMTATSEDTRIILNRGLTVSEDNDDRLGVRGKGDSALLQSVDSKRMVRNLCSSQKYHKWDHFLTFTCNQKTHFGTKVIRAWLDSGEWKKHYPGFFDLDTDEQEEIKKAIIAASAPLLLRVWEEVYLLFVTYLQKSKSSPFRNQKALFSRKEYQKDRGNLSHAHMMIELDWEKMTDEEANFVDDLIRASLCDIVKSSEIPSFIDKGVFEAVEDAFEVSEDGELFLSHVCNDSCLVRMPDGRLRCRKLNNAKISPDNTKHTFMKLPNNYSVTCLRILEEIGLTDELEIDKDGNVLKFKGSIPFFHPQRHVPPTNTTNDKNISPVEGYLFTVCRSMQNVQRLVGTGGCSKYICKYIAKLDEQNYVVIEVDGEDKLVTQATYLHNTKVSSSKMGEEKLRKNVAHKPQGRCISLLEMLHIMLKYPEVVRDVEFCQVPTMPLESRPAVKINSNVEQDEDRQYQTSTIDNMRRNILQLDGWRQHSENQTLVLDDVKLSKISIDKVTQFSLRPPEFLKVFDQLGNYYRWFEIQPTKVPKDKLDGKINESFLNSCWIDGLQRQVKVRRKALPEIMEWFQKIIIDDNINMSNVNDPRVKVIRMFNKIMNVLNGTMIDDDFKKHIHENLLAPDSENHLPVPVYSYINPSMGVQFIHHIMLSMGRFETEVNLTTQRSIRDSLRYCKLIGEDIDTESLKQYANNLLKLFITEQLQYFPNTQRVLDSWIISAYGFFHSIIVDDDIPMTEMPPVLLSNLHAATQEEIVQHRKKLTSTLIDAALEEMGDNRNLYNIPGKDDLISTTAINPIDWNALGELVQSEEQSYESFLEQKHAIDQCIQTIDNYTDLSNTNYTKNIGIRGFPGAGKSWCMMYVALYALSRGLKCVTTAMMCNRALQLGGIHLHQLILLPPDENLSAHRKAELAIMKLLKTPKKLEFLRSLDVIFFDEMGQVSAEMLNILDMVLREIRGSNVYMGGVLIIFTMDHTQIQPIKGRPFLTSCNMISSFRMVSLEKSVRASGDPKFMRLQQIARYNYKVLQEKPHLVDEFVQLCRETLTFAETWDDPRILPETMRLYSKKVPAREASRKFVERVRRRYHTHEIKEKIADDVQKSRYSHRDWSPASTSTVNALEQRLKEPKELLFFKRATYEITYNEQNKFSHGQIAILFDMPTEEQLQNWKKIKVLVAPPGKKDFEFNETDTKEDLLSRGFVETEIGCAPARAQYLSDNVQAIRKQYGLRHRISSTIHAAMGDTLKSMATEISRYIEDFKLWDKGQLIVILSRTRIGKNSIFVGNENETINALKSLLTKKTQWTDYMDEVLKLITIRNNNNSTENNLQPRRRIMTVDSFPYRICDITLPQCNTGYVYMIVSIKNKNQVFFRYTESLRNSINNHNRGILSMSTEPPQFRPYALVGFISGFDKNKDLMEHVRDRWEHKQRSLVMENNNNVKEWVLCGADVIESLNRNTVDGRCQETKLTCIALLN